MAGDWIKIRHTLPDDPRVMRMAMGMGADRDRVLGLLVRFWVWADQHTEDGMIKGVAGGELVDGLLGAPGFTAALEDAGWLRATDGGYELPRFEEHCSETAKKRARNRQWMQTKRATSTTRKEEKSGRAASTTGPQNDHKKTTRRPQNVHTSSTPEKRREEKRIEEKRRVKNHSSSSSGRVGSSVYNLESGSSAPDFQKNQSTQPSRLARDREQWLQGFLLRIATAFGWTPDVALGQRDAMMANGLRLVDRKDRDECRDRAIELVDGVMGRGLKKPVARWQKMFNERFPARKGV